MAKEIKASIPNELWAEWEKVTEPFRKASKRQEEAQAKKKEKKNGVKVETETIETVEALETIETIEIYEQEIRNKTLDEFIGHLAKNISEKHWLYVMACEIAEEMKGVTNEI